MPTAWAYGRVSGYAQARDGYSIEVQRDKALGYYDYKLKSQGFTWGGFFHDPAVSGNVRLADRPDGAKLAGALERGDAVIFAKLDRGFRNAIDALLTLDAWSARGVSFHFLDLGVDTSTDIGRLMVHMMAGFAQFERARIAERTAESKRLKAARGFWPYATAPWGFKRKKVKGGWVLEPNPAERQVGATCLELHDAGWSWEQIALHFITEKVKHPRGGQWNRSSMQEYAAKELGLRAAELKPDVAAGDEPGAE